MNAGTPDHGYMTVLELPGERGALLGQVCRDAVVSLEGRGLGVPLLLMPEEVVLLVDKRKHPLNF